MPSNTNISLTDITLYQIKNLLDQIKNLLAGSTIVTVAPSVNTILTTQSILSTFSILVVTGTIRAPYTLSILTDASSLFVLSGANQLQINAAISVGVYPITIRLTDALSLTTDHAIAITVTSP